MTKTTTKNQNGRKSEGTVAKLDISGPAAGAKASSPSALFACFSADRPSSAILLATGSLASPGFTEALFEDKSGALCSTLTIASGAISDVGGSGQGGDEGTGEKSAPAHVVGPGELGIKGFEKDNADSFGDGGEEADEDGRPLKRLKGDEAGMSIAERLEALSEEIDEEGARRSIIQAKSTGTLALPNGMMGGEQPRVESLATVLTQALQSGDNGLLEKCLGVSEQGVIEATVERLPSSKVLPFLLRYGPSGLECPKKLGPHLHLKLWVGGSL